MANALHPTVNGRIAVQFTSNALARKTVEERNRYLEYLRLELSKVLDNFRWSCDDIIDGWYIELYDCE